MRTNFTMGYIEEEAFSELCRALITLDACKPQDVETRAHEIMDAFTFDGILNVNALYSAINAPTNTNYIIE